MTRFVAIDTKRASDLELDIGVQLWLEQRGNEVALRAQSIESPANTLMHFTTKGSFFRVSSVEVPGKAADSKRRIREEVV